MPPPRRPIRLTLAAALAWTAVACSSGSETSRTVPVAAAALTKAADDVPIGPHGQVVDVYKPPGTPNGKLLVWIHGGGWVMGSEEDINTADGNQAPRFLVTDHGWTVLSLRYRLADGTVRLNDQIADVHAAVRWGREHATELGIDPGQISLMGFSAGGQLAVMAALTAGVAEFQPPWIAGDSAVQAAVSLGGAFCLDQDPVHPTCAEATPKVLGCDVGACDPAVVAAARPETWATEVVGDAGSPRLRFVAGDADPIVDSAHSRLVADRLGEQLGSGRVQFELVTTGPVEHRGHNIDAGLDAAALVKFLNG